jgi:hypothetical protein
MSQQEIDDMPRMYVGKTRRDRRVPVTFVFPRSGKRLRHNLTTEKLEEEIEKFSGYVLYK